MTDGIDLGIAGITDATLVASGGFGRVYRARQPGLDRWVAVKVLEGVDEAGLARFDRERRAMGRLSQHPNVVPVYESGVNGRGEPFLVMPFLEAGSLQDRVERTGPIAWQDAVEVLVTVSRAVDHAHQSGVIHRDIKPANVLLDDAGTPMVTDFGIAHLVSGDLATAPASLTPAYSPPEVLRGEQASEQTDVYALSATFVALVTGSPPFGTSDSPGGLVELARRIQHDRAPDLAEVGVPEPIASVIERGLAKDPADRPTGAASLASLLEGSVRVGALESPPGKRRRRLAAVAGLLGAAALVAVAAVAVWGNRDTGEQPTSDSTSNSAQSQSESTVSALADVGEPSQTTVTDPPGGERIDIGPPLAVADQAGFNITRIPIVPISAPLVNADATWVLAQGYGGVSLMRIDSNTLSVTDMIPVWTEEASSVSGFYGPIDTPHGITLVRRSGQDASEILRIDPASRAIDATLAFMPTFDPENDPLSDRDVGGDWDLLSAAYEEGILWVVDVRGLTAVDIEKMEIIRRVTFVESVPYRFETESGVESRFVTEPALLQIGSPPVVVNDVLMLFGVGSRMVRSSTGEESAQIELLTSVDGECWELARDFDIGLAAPLAAFEAIWVSAESEPGFRECGGDAQRTAVLRIDPATGQLPDVIELSDVSSLAATEDAIWVSQPEDDTVSRIDPITLDVTRTIPVGLAPGDMASALGLLWVQHDLEPMIWAIDPVTLEVVERIDVGENDYSHNRSDGAEIVGTPDALWAKTDTQLVVITDASPDPVTVIDVADQLVRPSGVSIPPFWLGATGMPDSAPWVASGAVWVPTDSGLTRLDPATDNDPPTRVSLPGDPLAMAEAAGSVFVATAAEVDDCLRNVALSRLTDSGSTVSRQASIETGPCASALDLIAVDQGLFLVEIGTPGRIRVIDLATLHVEKVVETESPMTAFLHATTSHLYWMSEDGEIVQVALGDQRVFRRVYVGVVGPITVYNYGNTALVFGDTGTAVVNLVDESVSLTQPAPSGGIPGMGFSYSYPEDGLIAFMDSAAQWQQLEIGGSPGPALMLPGGPLWVPDLEIGRLTFVDRNTLEFGSIGVGAAPSIPVPVGGRLWVASATDGTVTIVDPAHYRIDQ